MGFSDRSSKWIAAALSRVSLILLINLTAVHSYHRNVVCMSGDVNDLQIKVNTGIVHMFTCIPLTWLNMNKYSELSFPAGTKLNRFFIASARQTRPSDDIVKGRLPMAAQRK